MMDFADARRRMVDGQVRTADVTDPRLVGALLDVPRERFVPEDRRALAYLDLDLLVSEEGKPERRLLKPLVLAKLIQLAEVVETDRVLDVGCATGYSSALLARLADAVVGLEEDAGLARYAAEAIAATGARNASVAGGPLVAGWAAQAPYGAILLQGACEVVPSSLFGQLADGGRLVCVLGRGQAAKAMVYRRVGGEVGGRAVFDAAAPLLPGFSKPPAFVF